jgi:diaminohydroxyphosphoribosylaminopyrimidine deaminase / 5-amino-6-(5-phosphoribosylamino)uracil reductase
LSDKNTSVLTHKWRSECDAILVGKKTVITDDPALNVRSYSGAHPIRVILDSQLSLDSNLKVMDNTVTTIVLNIIQDHKSGNTTFIKLKDLHDIDDILKTLFDQGIYSVMVEGGAQVLNSFISSGLWHEARVIKTKYLLNQGIKAPFVMGKLLHKIQIGEDDIVCMSNAKFSHI